MCVRCCCKIEVCKLVNFGCQCQKKEAKVDRVARKRCFFTAGVLLFSSDGTIFDKLLYYMFENLMSFNEKTRFLRKMDPL